MKQLLGVAIVLVGISYAACRAFSDDEEDPSIELLISRGYSADPDPRCHGLTRILPIIDDCTHYLVCKKGRSKVKECYGGLHFDRYKHCTQPENAECWRTGVPETAPPFDCPKAYGYFAHPTDCTKYVVCHDGRPEEKQCPDNKTYRPFSGCIPYECTPIENAEEHTARIRPF